MERRLCILFQATKDTARAFVAQHKPLPTDEQKLTAIDVDVKSHLSVILPHNWLVKVRQIILNLYKLIMKQRTQFLVGSKLCWLVNYFVLAGHG